MRLVRRARSSAKFDLLNAVWACSNSTTSICLVPVFRPDTWASAKPSEMQRRPDVITLSAIARCVILAPQSPEGPYQLSQNCSTSENGRFADGMQDFCLL